ncbi:MAG: GNAT family N-acetyltransferase [Deltaproteobacteria bacterium]|nr:GNAT family N-acetyltransferase [Deltaproteobacteria bacterium]
METAFARFLAGIGHRVVTTGSGEWFDAGPRFFLNLPFHRTITPASAELRQVFHAGGALGVRFVAPLDGPGRLSYQIVCDAKPYDLEQLSANTRSKIRRGLRRCHIEPAPCALVAEQGWPAHVDTLRRQGRLVRDDEAARRQWRRYWAAAASTPEITVWTATVDGQLAAYLLTIAIEDRVEFLQARSCDSLLSSYPNNALIYAVTRDTLARAEVSEITFGLESLEAVDALDQFKFAMGFRRRPLRQRVVTRAGLGRLLQHPAVLRAVRWRAQQPAAHPRWRKLAGIIEFMREDATAAPSHGATTAVH